MREYVLDEISSISFQSSELIDPKRLGNALTHLIADNSSSTLYAAESLWKEFSTYLWEKVFFKTKPWNNYRAN